MENPPRIRPWTRLGSTIRVEPPATQPRPPPPSIEPSFIRRPTIFQIQPQPQPQPQAQPRPQPQPQPQPTQAPPAPTPVAESPPLSPRPSAPISSSPPQTLMPTLPTPKSSPQPSKASVPASPIPKTSPTPKTNSPPQPKMTVSSPKPKSYSPPKPSTPLKPPSSALPKSSSFQKQETEEYFKLTKPTLATTTPPQSPRTKPFARPPSPLTLPSSQLNPVPEPESKTVVMAEHKNIFPRGEKDWKNNELQRNSNSSIAAHNRVSAANGVGEGQVHQKKEKDSHKKTSTEEHEEEGVRVITIAGENSGAYMDLGSSKNKANHHPQHLQKNNLRARNNNGSDSNSNSSSSSDEGKSKKKGDRASTATAPPMKAFVNSNVQGVNNSILFNSTCAHSDPGVHLSFSKKPTTQ